MSNTFHSTEHTKPELITRRMRKGQKNPQLEGAENITLSYLLTESIIQKTRQSAQKGCSFVLLCRDIIRDADYDTANLEYIGNMGHPIYSDTTEGKINALLAHNPELTHTYFERPEDATLKIGLSEIQPKKKLTEKEIESLRVRLWGILYVLYPPQDYIESARYVRTYLEGIRKIL